MWWCDGKGLRPSKWRLSGFKSSCFHPMCFLGSYGSTNGVAFLGGGLGG